MLDRDSGHTNCAKLHNYLVGLCRCVSQAARVFWSLKEMRFVCTAVTYWPSRWLSSRDERQKTIPPLFPPPEVRWQGCLKHGMVTAAGSGRHQAAVRDQKGRWWQINAQVIMVHLFTPPGMDEELLVGTIMNQNSEAQLTGERKDERRMSVSD